MGFDRLGRPIVATQYGSLRLWEMTKLTSVERMTELHAMEQELLLRLLRRRTLDGGGRDEENGGGRGGGHIVDTAVVVIDTAGLTLRHVRGCLTLPLKAAPSGPLSFFFALLTTVPQLVHQEFNHVLLPAHYMKALRRCLIVKLARPKAARATLFVQPDCASSVDRYDTIPIRTRCS